MPTPEPVGSILHLEDGSFLQTTDSLEIARKKAATKQWQVFHTPEGNHCRVNCSKVKMVAMGIGGIPEEQAQRLREKLEARAEAEKQLYKERSKVLYKPTSKLPMKDR